MNANEIFMNNISIVQEWMNKNVTGESGVSSATIFAGMKGTALGEMKPTDFQINLSLSVKSGKIAGFIGKKGKGGGYFPVGKVPVKAREEGTEDVSFPSTMSVFHLGEGYSLINGDNNWTLKRPAGPDLHFGRKTEHAFKRVAEVMIDDHIPHVSGDLAKLKEGLEEAVVKVVKILETNLKA